MEYSPIFQARALRFELRKTEMKSGILPIKLNYTLIIIV